MKDNKIDEHKYTVQRGADKSDILTAKPMLERVATTIRRKHKKAFYVRFFNFIKKMIQSEKNKTNEKYYKTVSDPERANKVLQIKINEINSPQKRKDITSLLEDKNNRNISIIQNGIPINRMRRMSKDEQGHLTETDMIYVGNIMTIDYGKLRKSFKSEDEVKDYIKNYIDSNVLGIYGDVLKKNQIVTYIEDAINDKDILPSEKLCHTYGLVEDGNVKDIVLAMGKDRIRFQKDEQGKIFMFINDEPYPAKNSPVNDLIVTQASLALSGREIKENDKNELTFKAYQMFKDKNVPKFRKIKAENKELNETGISLYDISVDKNYETEKVISVNGNQYNDIFKQKNMTVEEEIANGINKSENCKNMEKDKEIPIEK